MVSEGSIILPLLFIPSWALAIEPPLAPPAVQFPNESSPGPPSRDSDQIPAQAMAPLVNREQPTGSTNIYIYIYECIYIYIYIYEKFIDRER